MVVESEFVGIAGASVVIDGSWPTPGRGLRSVTDVEGDSRGSAAIGLVAVDTVAVGVMAA
jgi:hypothetical protein